MIALFLLPKKQKWYANSKQNGTLACCSWNYTPLSTAYLCVTSSMFIHMYFLYVLYVYILFYVFTCIYAFIYFLYLCFCICYIVMFSNMYFYVCFNIMYIYFLRFLCTYISVIEIQYGILVFSTEIFFFLIPRVLYAAYVRIILIVTMIVYDHVYRFEIILLLYKDILFFVVFFFLYDYNIC